MKIDRITLLFLILLTIGSFFIFFVVSSRTVKPPRAAETRNPLYLNHYYQAQVRRLFTDYLAARIELESWEGEKKIAEWSRILEKLREDFLKLRLGPRFQREHLAVLRQMDKLRQALREKNWTKLHETEVEMFRLFYKI